MKSDFPKDRDIARATTSPQALRLAANADASEVRSEAVARAQKLIADPNYPDATIVARVAQQLSRHLSSGVGEK